jgi:hypothetical protein
MPSIPADETTGSSAVLRVIFEDLTRPERVQCVVEDESLVRHLLLGVLRDSEGLLRGLVANRIENCLDIVRVR